MIWGPFDAARPIGHDLPIVRTDAPTPMPSFRTPERPDPMLIEMLHRRGKHHIGFYRGGRNTGVKFEELGGFRADEIDELLPEFVPHLLADSYFSNNGLNPPRKNDQVNRLTGYQVPSRKAADCAVITSAYVDLDPRNTGMSQGQVLGELWDLQKGECIPAPSILTDSGRGFWAYWIIRHPITGMPVEADQVARNQHRAIEEELIRRLMYIGADPIVRDIPRISRVPGSVNTQSVGKRRVGFVVLADHQGCMPAYTLGELCAWLDVEAAARTVSIGRKRTPKNDQERTAEQVCRARGQRRRYEVVIESIKVLTRVRGGRIGVGHRNYMLLYLGWAMKSLRAEESQYGINTLRELADELKRINADHCEHPHGDAIIPSQVDAIARQAWRMNHPVPHNTISDALDITLEEYRAIEAEVGHKCLPASARWRPKRAPATASQKRDARRELIQRELADRGGEVPTLAELAAACWARLGFEPSRTTLADDLKKLGITTGRERALTPDAEPALI